ncbi:MAG: manganese efflux pump [Planctomycetes bacterium]|nr:manganese efflux pump [Planctomycetota bacterium]
MSYTSLFIISVGLAMDAFAVSITSGLTIKVLRLHHAMLIAGFFGFFQAIMPLLGWQLGRATAGWVSTCDHWVAFALLVFVGGKLIYEAIYFNEEQEPRNPLNLYVLFMLAIATSIDAFAVGISLSLLQVSLITPILLIGGVTFIMSFTGAYIGSHFGHLFEKKLEIVGGLLLIGIGVKILLEQIC